MCINRTTTTISLLLLAVSFEGLGRGVRARDDEWEAQTSLDISPSGRVDGTAHSLEGPWGGTENGLWVIWTSDRAHNGYTQTGLVERKG